MWLQTAAGTWVQVTAVSETERTERAYKGGPHCGPSTSGLEAAQETDCALRAEDAWPMVTARTSVARRRNSPRSCGSWGER